MTTPWTVDVTETGVYLCAGVEDVAEFRHSGRHGAAISQEEAVANATLAAAAGKLLAALVQLAAEFDKFRNSGNPIEFVANEAMRSARAAIAKARKLP